MLYNEPKQDICERIFVMRYEYGFIGCGNMGGAIVKAVSKQVDGARICICDRDSAKCDALSKECGVSIEDIIDLAKESRHIVLGVKPQMMADTLAEIKEILAGRDDAFILVTMAAGITTDKLCEMAGGEYPVIRIMPNTPVAVGEGVVLYCANAKVSDSDVSDFRFDMAKAGLVSELPEKLIDAGSAVSGCGPAFVCMMIEALADGGVECGLPRDKALDFAAKTFMGTAALLLETGKHPGKLKDEVCSPGGTTIEGVHALESGKLRGTVMDAVKAAYEKNFKLIK